MPQKGIKNFDGSVTIQDHFKFGPQFLGISVCKKSGLVLFTEQFTDLNGLDYCSDNFFVLHRELHQDETLPKIYFQNVCKR